MNPKRGEDAVDIEESESVAGTTEHAEEPVGRVQGQDVGYAGETGADARADLEGDGIGGAAGGRQ